MPESKAEKPETKNKENTAEREAPREETVEWIFTVKAKTGELVKIEHGTPGAAQRKEVSLEDYAAAAAQHAQEQAQEQAQQQAQQQYAAMAYGQDPYLMYYSNLYDPYGSGYAPYGVSPWPYGYSPYGGY